MVPTQLLPPCYHAMAAHPHVTDSDFECFTSHNTTEMMIRVIFIYRASAISRQWGINVPPATWSFSLKEPMEQWGETGLRTDNFKNSRNDRNLEMGTLSLIQWLRFSRLVVSDSLRPLDCSLDQAPLSIGFSRQEYWNGLPFPFPGDFPDPGIEPRSPALQAESLPRELEIR